VIVTGSDQSWGWRRPVPVNPVAGSEKPRDGRFLDQPLRWMAGGRGPKRRTSVVRALRRGTGWRKLGTRLQFAPATILAFASTGVGRSTPALWISVRFDDSSRISSRRGGNRSSCQWFVYRKRLWADTVMSVTVIGGLFLRTFQNPHGGKDRVPVACGCWHTEQLIDPAKIADGLHVPTVHSKDELVLRRDYSHEPLPVGRKCELAGQRGCLRL
jgi:hypothetical protein